MFKDIRLESTSVVELAGRQWTETRSLGSILGRPLRSRQRFYSDDRGTIFITTTTSAEGSDSYSRIADRILESVRLEESVVGIDDRLVGLWESVNAPVRITQEFTRDGQSKIAFAGTTHTGKYKLKGNDIDWSSGSMNLKVKVKFYSPTDIELSNEAGQTVRYKKQVNVSNEGIVIDGKGPVDLLKLIDLRRDVVAGDWKFVNGVLMTGARPQDRLEIPVDVPAEYRLTMVAQCNSHREALHIGLVAHPRQVLAIFDGWSRTSTCLHLIDKTDGVQFPHHRGPVLRDREPNVITCEVRSNRIQVDCNNVRVIDWTGDVRRLSIDARWKVRSEKHLFIGSWDTSFAISKLEMTPL